MTAHAMGTGVNPEDFGTFVTLAVRELSRTVGGAGWAALSTRNGIEPSRLTDPGKDTIMNIVGLLLFIASSALLALDIFEYINGLWARIAYILPLFLASALISQRWYSIINLDDTITPLDKEGLSSKFIGLLRKIYSYYPFLIPILPTAAAIARPTERVLFALTGETINVSSSRVFSLYIGGTPFSAILIIFIPGSLLTLIYQWVPSFVSIITTSRLIILMMLVCISSLFVSLSALFLTYLRTLFARRI